MFTLKSAAILALIGSALAAPLAHRDVPEFGRYTRKIVQVVPTSDDQSAGTRIVYVYGNKGNKGGNNNNNDDDDDADVEVNTGSNSGSGSGSTGTGSTDTSTDTGASAGTGSNTGYMAIVAKYRAAGGLPAFTQSSKLEANARKTAADGNGQMVHQLNPGTFGQVLAPGNANNFESVYVGGWLCERPGLKGLNGICNTMTKGWNHDGQTGHADILTDPKYKEIGCSLETGIWACDVA